jgi:hypothetical protein
MVFRSRGMSAVILAAVAKRLAWPEQGPSAYRTWGLGLCRIQDSDLGRSIRMTSDRKKPGVAFWATVVLVVVLVGYPLSFGPAAWLAIRTGNLKLVQGWFWAPLETVVVHGPDQLVTRYNEFVFWWMATAGGEPEYEIGPAFRSSADE